MKITKISTKQFVTVLLSFLKEVGLEFSAETFARWVFGPSFQHSDIELVEQLRSLAKEGKVKEAEDLLHARPGGVGFYDEAMVFSDYSALVRSNLFNPTQAANVLDFFTNELSERERTNFRIMYTKQVNPEIRRMDLYVLALEPDHAHRRQVLEMTGALDDGPLGHAEKAFEALGDFSRLHVTQYQLQASQLQIQINAIKALNSQPFYTWLAQGERKWYHFF